MKGCAGKRPYFLGGGDSNTYPNPGPQPGTKQGVNFLTSPSLRGGNCASCSLMHGGSSGNGGRVFGPTLPPLNIYNHGDVSREMIAVGANKPFVYGGSNNQSDRRRRRRTFRRRLPYHGGATFSNLIGQDVINLGRQAQYGVSTAYNGILGKPPSSSNPLPWKQPFL